MWVLDEAESDGEGFGDLVGEKEESGSEGIGERKW